MSVLDLDFYKLTMLQFIWKHYADVPVTFRLHSRKQKLSDVVNPIALKAHIDKYRNTRLRPHEKQYLYDLGIFEMSFLDDLEDLFDEGLPEPRIQWVEPSCWGETEVSGDWFSTSIWETVILSAVSEEYSKNNVDKPDAIARFADIHTIGQSGAKWADFGTRRRYSKWEHYDLMDVMEEFGAGHGFIGTSNVDLARVCNLKPIGTYAHELEMVLNTVHNSEFYTTRDVLRKWGDMYPRDLRIALTDTYTTPMFLANHGEFLLDNDWRGVRLDSGNPFEIGQKVANFVAPQGKEWDVVFSDGLDAETIVKLQRIYGLEPGVNPVYGWGTGLTNPNSDLSLVMKAVEANGKQTYKVTDDAEKSIR